MAWKRGTQNLQAGIIRKGQIKEFLLPSSHDFSISIHLTVCDLTISLKKELKTTSHTTPYAFINKESLTNDIAKYVNEKTGLLYLHAHQHPKCVITCTFSSFIPIGKIALPEDLRLNSKVCIGENEEWTVYQGFFHK
jgi:hypothetical protein